MNKNISHKITKPVTKLNETIRKQMSLLSKLCNVSIDRDTLLFNLPNGKMFEVDTNTSIDSIKNIPSCIKYKNEPAQQFEIPTSGLSCIACLSNGYRLIFQGDSNLVLHNYDNEVLFAFQVTPGTSRTGLNLGKNTFSFSMQNSSGVPIDPENWADGYDNFYVEFSVDRGLVLVDCDTDEVIHTYYK